MIVLKTYFQIQRLNLEKLNLLKSTNSFFLLDLINRNYSIPLLLHHHVLSYKILKSKDTD